MSSAEITVPTAATDARPYWLSHERAVFLPGDWPRWATAMSDARSGRQVAEFYGATPEEARAEAWRDCELRNDEEEGRENKGGEP